ncbi:MAG: ABC transporter ATP-binding protein [Proteobacteria bacterium]|nr:ABC transporter ATP-binding protein [Pseudomonadota bacterium]MBU1742560.1 ABC transporter ATP-binding protein [Pseudomonadota bacterium]
MLKLSEVHTYYGDTYVLRGLSLEVPAGSVVALLGRNGMGKTTTIRSIVGLAPPRSGSISLNGRELTRLKSHQIAKAGIGLVPQGRHIFPSLSVMENLSVAARTGGRERAWSLDGVYEQFPILRERAGLKGNLLSGGEQQMLAIARALMTNPVLMLMDEPSEGLAPLIVRQIGDIILQLKETGISLLVVEQNYPLAQRVADYVYVIAKGQIVHHCSMAELDENEEIKVKYLCAT